MISFARINGNLVDYDGFGFSSTGRNDLAAPKIDANWDTPKFATI